VFTILFVLAFTLAVPAETAAASEVEAVFVFELIFEVAVLTTLVVLLFTLTVPAEIADANEVVAVTTSDCRASVPTVRVPLVRLRVPYVHTSAAVIAEEVSVLAEFAHTSATSVPNVLSDRVGVDHTFNGIVDASEVEAVSTVEFVFALIVETAPVTSDCVASEPKVRVLSVRLRVALFHTSATSVPKLLKVLFVYAHTLAGIEAIEAASEVEAVVTILFVLAFTAFAIEVVALLLHTLAEISVVEAPV
jgi:hypothetical protein